VTTGDGLSFRRNNKPASRTRRFARTSLQPRPPFPV